MESATLTRPRTERGWTARLRAVPATGWAAAGLAALAVVSLVGYLVYPTFPNYDSYYAMLWAREVLHLQHLSFAGYRTPTEHPLAILFSIPLVLLGQGGDRVMVFFTVASFVALAAGLYRLGRQSFGPLAGAVAALLICTRFDFPFLAARGYIDIPYLALVVWAAALEVGRPRRPRWRRARGGGRPAAHADAARALRQRRRDLRAGRDRRAVGHRALPAGALADGHGLLRRGRGRLGHAAPRLAAAPALGAGLGGARDLPDRLHGPARQPCLV